MACLNTTRWIWASVMPQHLPESYAISAQGTYLDSTSSLSWWRGGLGQEFWRFIQNLRSVLLRFRQYSLKLKPKKCQLFRCEVEFLGKLVSADRIKIAPSKAEAVHKWPFPINKKELMAFQGYFPGLVRGLWPRLASCDLWLKGAAFVYNNSREEYCFRIFTVNCYWILELSMCTVWYFGFVLLSSLFVLNESVVYWTLTMNINIHLTVAINFTCVLLF